MLMWVARMAAEDRNRAARMWAMEMEGSLALGAPVAQLDSNQPEFHIV